MAGYKSTATDVCAALDALIAPVGTAGNTLHSVVVERDNGGAIVGCALDDRCCTVEGTLVDGNGDPVLVSIDTDTGITTYYDVNGTIIPAPVLPLSVFSEAPLVLTTDGTATGVTQGGTANHTVNIVLRSTAAGNALTIGLDGGLVSTDLCTDIQALLPRPAGVAVASTVVVGDDSNCYRSTDPCSFTAPGGATGQPSGMFIDACVVEDLAGAAAPNAGFPAANYPEWWRQGFTNGLTGSETWVVRTNGLGNLDWDQV